MHPVPCPTLPDTQACPLQGLLSTFPVPSNTRILLCRLMFYRTLLHTLLTQPIPLSKTPSLLFYPKIYFPLAQQETKSTCASCSSSFQGNVLHWLKSFSFPLSTAFSPHLCLRACCMIRNSFVARRRIQFENVNQKKKGILLSGIIDVSRNAVAEMQWSWTWTRTAKPLAFFSPFFSLPLSLLHFSFVHSHLVASCSHGRIPISRERTWNF